MVIITGTSPKHTCAEFYLVPQRIYSEISGRKIHRDAATTAVAVESNSEYLETFFSSAS